jgi:hypothetical protein
MPKEYEVSGTTYSFPDTFDDAKVKDILMKKGIIKAPAAKAPTTKGPFQRGLQDVVTGAGKELLGQGINLSKLDPFSSASERKAIQGLEPAAKLGPSKLEHAGATGMDIVTLFAPIPGLGELSKAPEGARLVKLLAGAGRDAIDIFIRTYARTADLGTSAKAAGIGGAFSPVIRKASEKLAELVGPKIKGTGKSIYEAELRTGTKPTLQQREEMVERGLKPGAELPIEKHSLPKIQTEIDANKARINTLTKDPQSPYSARTVPIDNLLTPVDQWINRVARVDKPAAAALRRARGTWAKSLGGGSETTVADAQRLKEDLYAVLNSSAYAETAEPGTLTAGKKLAARGLKTGIEKAVPEEPLRDINHVIENDIRLKDTITSAIKRHPSWINDWAVFVLGTGAGEALAGHLGGGTVAVGALARMIARNPRVMSRLAIALNRSGMPDLSEGLSAGMRAGITVGASSK